MTTRSCDDALGCGIGILQSVDPASRSMTPGYMTWSTGMNSDNVHYWNYDEKM